ncbi:alkaline phosphatase D family protein [Pseudoalteromonas sp. B137]
MTLSTIAPYIGPVIGLTTSSTVRIMAGVKGNGTDKENTGYIRFKPKSIESWSTPKRFRFNKSFYYTGVIELTGLTPSTRYEYQVVVASEEAPVNEDMLNWEGHTIFQFNTLTTAPPEHFSFCFGSCMRHSRDGRFGKVLRKLSQLHSEAPVDFMLWLGDQVYNDELMFLTPKNSTEADFKRRYNNFYNNKYVKNVVANIPNLMVIDDHEIENSFTDGTNEYMERSTLFSRNNQERLINGMLAIYSYQLSHGPIFDTEPDNTQVGVSFVKGQKLNQVPVKHYEVVKFNDIGLFLLDTRKERDKDMFMSRAQEKELIEFLDNQDLRVKLIASSVTFLVDYKGKTPKKADNWLKAYKQRNRILNHIIDNEISNIVFLSGDVHSHFATQLKVNGINRPIYQLVSGSLFWPTGYLMNRIRWSAEKVKYGQIYKARDGFEVSKPLSETTVDFFENNGLGYVEIDADSLTFKVFNHEGKVAIKVTLDLA